MPRPSVVLLCPGQGAQTIGMGKTWMETHPAAAQTFAAADAAVELPGGHPLKSQHSHVHLHMKG